MRRLDLGALFSEVRLYGQVNTQCKILLRSTLQRLPSLTHLNLESKCNDEMLLELAKYCPNLEDLNIPTSDVTDRGLMALCGISIIGGLDNERYGCFKLSRIGIHNCINITVIGVGSVLRNLPRISQILYDKLADAIETVAKIDGDYISGKKTFNIVHLDQFADYYDFDSHPDLLAILLRVCPKLESLRFYISDEGCKNLSQISNIKHLQLEMEDVGNGFRLLTRQYYGLISLQLTFRTMPFSQLIDIADNCPNLKVLRLIGFEISDSRILVPHNNVFASLKTIDLRMVRQGPWDDEDVAMDVVDTITPQLMHFLLDFSHDLEELTVEAVANFMNVEFLYSILAKNQFQKLTKLRLSISPANNGLSFQLAKHLLDVLPELQMLGLSRWNISGRDFRHLLHESKKNNWDMVFV